MMISKQQQVHNELHKLQEKEKYTSYQEELGFSKELNILRNDFYYQMVGDAETSASLIDFLYQPLDVLSGDAYTARFIDESCTFYLIVDGMGKGLSASLTTMIMTSFINHLVDKMLEHDHFDLHLLVFESLAYIKKILLDEEALALDYILIDNEQEEISYAKFAMPASLMQNLNGEILRLKSNNPPLSKYHDEFKISTCSIKDIEKFLFYSDGIVENSTEIPDMTYADFIEEDFKNSFTRKELVEKIFKKIAEPEDDLTLAFINRINFTQESFIASRTFKTSLACVDLAGEWYNEIFDSVCSDVKESYQANVVFTELYMNAYEHGNLGVDSATKHKLLDEDKYFETLSLLEKECDKEIRVSLYKIVDNSSSYIVTKISDDGQGFDTQILSAIFRNSQAFNGRGVFVSRKNSMGIYYNTKGNTVLYLNKI